MNFNLVTPLNIDVTIFGSKSAHVMFKAWVIVVRLQQAKLLGFECIFTISIAEELINIIGMNNTAFYIIG